jgi:hypothetical protein
LLIVEKAWKAVHLVAGKKRRENSCRCRSWPFVEEEEWRFVLAIE